MDSRSQRRKIIDYIKKNLKKNYPIDSLKFALLEQGYTRSIVELAIEDAKQEIAKEVPILKDKPVIKHEIIDEYNRPVEIKKPFWKKIFG